MCKSLWTATRERERRKETGVKLSSRRLVISGELPICHRQPDFFEKILLQAAVCNRPRVLGRVSNRISKSRAETLLRPNSLDGVCYYQSCFPESHWSSRQLSVCLKKSFIYLTKVHIVSPRMPGGRPASVQRWHCVPVQKLTACLNAQCIHIV